MNERRVRFTATAQGHVDRERTWWLGNRDYRDLFATELEAATQLLAVLPGAGTPYTGARVQKFSYKGMGAVATPEGPHN